MWWRLTTKVVVSPLKLESSPHFASWSNNHPQQLKLMEKKYRILSGSETQQVGDEYRSLLPYRSAVNNEWHPVVASDAGTRADSWKMMEIRRPVATEQPHLIIKLNHLYRTRDGRKARVVCVDRKGEQPIVALLKDGSTDDCCRLFTAEGKYWPYSEKEQPEDLLSPWVDKPEVGEGFRLLEGDELPLASDEIWWKGYHWSNHSWHYAGDKETAAQGQARGIFFRRRTTPLVDWSAMPRWAKWVAMDANGEWFTYAIKPTQREGYFSGGSVGSIPEPFEPSFTGPWTASLVERPGDVASV